MARPRLALQDTVSRNDGTREEGRRRERNASLAAAARRETGSRLLAVLGRLGQRFLSSGSRKIPSVGVLWILALSWKAFEECGSTGMQSRLARFSAPFLCSVGSMNRKRTCALTMSRVFFLQQFSGSHKNCPVAWQPCPFFQHSEVAFRSPRRRISVSAYYVLEETFSDSACAK